MFVHVWRIVVFVYALSEALWLADAEATARSWLWAPVQLILATLFAMCAAWNFCQAIRAAFALAHRHPTPINDAELNDGLSEENVT
jgi:heme A synthase